MVFIVYRYSLYSYLRPIVVSMQRYVDNPIVTSFHARTAWMRYSIGASPSELRVNVVQQVCEGPAGFSISTRTNL